MANLIPFLIAGAGAYLVNKQSEINQDDNNHPIGGPITAQQREQLNYIKFLSDFVAYYKNKGGDDGNLRMGDLGYVRNQPNQNVWGGKQYMEPAIYDPLSGERIGMGNYTDMQHWILHESQQSNYPQNHNFSNVSLKKQQDLIDGFFSQGDLKNTLGPDGPHSTYWSSLYSKIDLSKVLTVLTDVILVCGAIAATVLTGGAAAPADVALLKKLGADFS